MRIMFDTRLLMRRVRHEYTPLFFFIDAYVCLTFNKIQPTRIHKHQWVATNRIDHHHHACLFSRFGARVRFHRGTSGRDKFFSLTTLTFDATGEKFLTLASDIIFFFVDYRVTALALQLSKTREQFYTPGRCPVCKLFPECNNFVSCNQAKTDYSAIFSSKSFNITDRVYIKKLIRRPIRMFKLKYI